MYAKAHGVKNNFLKNHKW